eukprot:361271-Chlamydomonas_euryale.AAC.3
MIVIWRHTTWKLLHLETASVSGAVTVCACVPQCLPRPRLRRGIERSHADLALPRYSHLLLAFGGATRDLHAAMAGADATAAKSPEDYFNMFLSVCPGGAVGGGGGGGALRTEDELLMALGYLRPAILQYGGNTHAAGQGKDK